MKLVILIILFSSSLFATDCQFKDIYILLIRVEDQGGFLVKDSLEMTLRTEYKYRVFINEKGPQGSYLSINRNPNLLIDSLMNIQGTNYLDSNFYYVFGKKDWLEQIKWVIREKGQDGKYLLNSEYPYYVKDSLITPICNYMYHSEKGTDSSISILMKKIFVYKYPEEPKTFQISNIDEYDELYELSVNEKWDLISESLERNKDYIIDSCFDNNKRVAVLYSGYIEEFMTLQPFTVAKIINDTCQFDFIYSTSRIMEGIIKYKNSLFPEKRKKIKKPKEVNYFISTNKINMVLIQGFEPKEGYHSKVGNLYYHNW